MGLLKFLQRKKKAEEFDDLDLPPAPPSLGGNEPALGKDFDDFNKDVNFPDFPEIDEKIDSRPRDFPKFDFPDIEDKMPKLGSEENVPDFPKFPEIEENTMPFTSPANSPQSIPERTPIKPEQMPKLEAEYPNKSEEASFNPLEAGSKSRLFKQERADFIETQSGKVIYVRIDKFKAMLGIIGIVRNDLKKSEEALLKLESIKNANDKSFNKIRFSLEDLQKKLIFIDRTLFKGD